MKFVILTDIHLGPQDYFNGVIRKISVDAKFYLDNFVNEMNNEVNPKFVVILGDLIQAENSDNDKKNISYVTNILSGLNCPTYYVAGNHDLRNISEDEYKNLLGIGKLYYSFDCDNNHFIVLHSKITENREIEIGEQQMQWLKRDLRQCDSRGFIFVHHGLADHNLTGNPWFEGKPEYALVKNRGDVRNLLEDSNKVAAVFNSHLHWDKKEVCNSITYYTIQSLVENEGDKGIASEAYAIVDISVDDISVNVKGNYSKVL